MDPSIHNASSSAAHVEGSLLDITLISDNFKQCGFGYQGEDPSSRGYKLSQLAVTSNVSLFKDLSVI